MSGAGADPRCPECGEPIGTTATYCMHCSADLTEELARADADEDGRWDTTGGSTDAVTTTPSSNPGAGSVGTAAAGQLLDPDGLVDDSLTVVVGLVGGFAVGLVGTLVLLFTTGSVWALPVGVVGWLVATAHLVRRRTVQGAVAGTGYGVALVLLSIPLVVLGPGIEGASLGDRAVGFLVLLVTFGVPAGIAAGVGYVASRYVPGSGTGG